MRHITYCSHASLFPAQQTRRMPSGSSTRGRPCSICLRCATHRAKHCSSPIVYIPGALVLPEPREVARPSQEYAPIMPPYVFSPQSEAPGTPLGLGVTNAGINVLDWLLLGAGAVGVQPAINRVPELNPMAARRKMCGMCRRKGGVVPVALAPLGGPGGAKEALRGNACVVGVAEAVQRPPAAVRPAARGRLPSAAAPYAPRHTHFSLLHNPAVVARAEKPLRLLRRSIRVPVSAQVLVRYAIQRGTPVLLDKEELDFAEAAQQAFEFRCACCVLFARRGSHRQQRMVALLQGNRESVGDAEMLCGRASLTRCARACLLVVRRLDYNQKVLMDTLAQGALQSAHCRRDTSVCWQRLEATKPAGTTHERPPRR